LWINQTTTSKDHPKAYTSNRKLVKSSSNQALSLSRPEIQNNIYNNNNNGYRPRRLFKVRRTVRSVVRRIHNTVSRRYGRNHRLILYYWYYRRHIVIPSTHVASVRMWILRPRQRIDCDTF
jgi:hypothetical protein